MKNKIKGKHKNQNRILRVRTMENNHRKKQTVLRSCHKKKIENVLEEKKVKKLVVTHKKSNKLIRKKHDLNKKQR